jgi:hypothetical protein
MGRSHALEVRKLHDMPPCCCAWWNGAARFHICGQVLPYLAITATRHFWLKFEVKLDLRMFLRMACCTSRKEGSTRQG